MAGHVREEDIPICFVFFVERDVYQFSVMDCIGNGFEIVEWAVNCKRQ